MADAAGIFVVAARPVWIGGSVAAFRRDVEVVIGAEECVEAARVGGVGQEDIAGLIFRKHAQSRKLLVDVARVDRNRAEIVVDLARGDQLFPEGDVEVVVEVALERRHPRKVPTHAFPVGQDLGERRAGHADDADVVMFEMRRRPVDMLGLKRTARTGRLPLRREHEMMDDELRATVEQLGQRLSPMLGVEGIRLFYLHPGKGAPLRGERVARTHMRLFLDEKRSARGDPFVL